MHKWPPVLLAGCAISSPSNFSKIERRVTGMTIGCDVDKDEDVNVNVDVDVDVDEDVNAGAGAGAGAGTEQ